MKLLTPEEIKTSKASELARDVRRTQDIKEALDKARTELNNTNAEFDSVLARQRVVWIMEEEKALNKIKELQVEIDALNRQKQQLLIPIDIDRKRADNIVIEANAIMAAAIEKQKYADEMAETLQDHLDEIGEKEEALEQREKHLFVQEKGVQEQIKIVKEIAQNTTNQAQQFLSDKDVQERDFNTRKTALELREISLEKRQIAQDEREAMLVAKEREINDKYATLLRTQKRLK